MTRVHPSLISSEQESLGIKNASLSRDAEGFFDPRSEVSADAKYIARKVVTHLWILFVALPIMLGIVYAILTAH